MMERARPWRVSRIALRLLTFNLLVVFAPVVGVLSLHTYEARLLQAQERAMAQQATVLASILEDEAIVTPDVAARSLARLRGSIESRIRVFSADGTLLADSASGPVNPLRAAESPYGQPGRLTSTRSRLLYRFGAWLVNARDAFSSAFRRTTRPEPAAATSGLTVALRSALAGKYGAASRPTPGQRSLTLFAALPVRRDGRIAGAVVVSQSTFRILQALYDVRLRVFRIVAASVALACLLTALAAMTVVRPLIRLRRRAATLQLEGGRLSADFPGTGRRDEVGELARALADLTHRVNAQIALLEGMTADIAHEFKNPLASIRTAAELASDAESDTDRRRFLAMLTRDVDRLERLVSGMRDVAKIEADAPSESAGGVDLWPLIEGVIAGLALRDGRRVVVSPPGPWSIRVRGNADRLVQAFENVIGNALSVSPDGAKVTVGLKSDSRTCTVVVDDEGPGIPDAHLQRIFERFFSYRPDDDRREHIGLGLAIARQVIERSGGSITASNRPSGGASFEIRLKST